MKKTIILVILIFSAFTLFSEEEYDFRKVRWGMSCEEVLKSENMEPIYNSHFLIAYNDILFNEPISLSYNFMIDRLSYVSVYFLKNLTLKESKCFEEYNRIKSLFIEKYGKPKVSKKLAVNIDEESSYVDIYDSKTDTYDEWSLKDNSVSLGIVVKNAVFYVAAFYSKKH